MYIWPWPNGWSSGYQVASGEGSHYQEYHNTDKIVRPICISVSKNNEGACGRSSTSVSVVGSGGWEKGKSVKYMVLINIILIIAYKIGVVYSQVYCIISKTFVFSRVIV